MANSNSFSALPAIAQCTYRVVQDGNFNNPGICAPQPAGALCSAAPAFNTSATIILTGHNVTLTSSFVLARGGSLTIDDGALMMAKGGSLVVKGGSVTVSSRGAIALGV